MTLDQHIEGVLFYKANPMKKAALAKLLDVTDEALEAALATLAARLEHGGTTLISTETDVTLATRPELDSFIEQLRKDEMKRDIGKAGAETLAIIIYKGPLTRAEIDRIRGVNSSYIVRNLEVRGLIERTTEGKQTQFVGTTALLAHLGVRTKTELGNYAEVMDALEKYEAQQAAEQI